MLEEEEEHEDGEEEDHEEEEEGEEGGEEEDGEEDLYRKFRMSSVMRVLNEQFLFHGFAKNMW